MARPKRDAKPFTMKMDNATHDRLEKYCNESGQTMTVAIERAINAYIDAYEHDQKILEIHSKE